MSRPVAPAPRPLPVALVGKKVAILGAGKVGTAVATLLREARVNVVATTHHDDDHAAAAAAGDIVLVTTNDDVIATVVTRIANSSGFRPCQLVVHMSGALRLSTLAGAAEAGAMVGCIHPLQSFATADDAVRELPGSVFGVPPGPTASEALLSPLSRCWAASRS